MFAREMAQETLHVEHWWDYKFPNNRGYSWWDVVQEGIKTRPSTVTVTHTPHNDMQL